MPRPVIVLQDVSNPERLGSLVLEVEIAEAERKLGYHLEIVGGGRGYYLPSLVPVAPGCTVSRSGQIANPALLDLWRRSQIRFLDENEDPAEAARNWPSSPEVDRVMPRAHPTLDLHGALDRVAPSVTLPEEWVSLGERYLREQGLPDGARWVCLHMRQSGWWHRVYGAEVLEEEIEREWDVAFENYEEAAAWLCDQGLWVVRMGRDERPWTTRDKRIIDYGAEHYDPRLDLFLMSRCHFYWGGGESGPLAYAELFRKPMVLTDCFPGESLRTFSSRHLSIFRRPIFCSSGEEIPLAHFLASSSKVLRDRSPSRPWALLANNSAEILAVVKEMVKRLEGSWVETSEAKAWQSRFQNLLHHCRNLPQTAWGGRVGAEFLEQLNEREELPLFRNRV